MTGTGRGKAGKKEITVLGAGVSGLTTAIRLLERGARIKILARERTPNTTSDIAAAVWFPYLCKPPARALPWARRSLDVYAELARDETTGVVFRDIIEPVAPDAPRTPWWAEGAHAWREARADERPAGFARAYVTHAPTIEMPRYLAWLERRARDLGATIEAADVRTLRDVQAARIVNATGLGAREVAGDATMRPIRGQVARVAPVPGVDRAILDQESDQAPAYVIPRADVIVLGGTAVEGAWDRTPDPKVEEEILRKAAALDARLAHARVVSRAVGLRPGRPTVRVERERIGDAIVVHNYGHGGAGVTLSWGCAEEAAALVLGA